MKNCQYLWFVLLVLLLSICSIFGAKEKPTNIVLIMSDDVSPDLYGCYGNNNVKTPNIDQMAHEGVMFRTAWASAICAPSRALIMTGRYGSTTGVYHNSLWMKDTRKRLFTDHTSFGKLIKEAGYATAIAGKWHCSMTMPYGDSVGFDEYCLWEAYFVASDQEKIEVFINWIRELKPVQEIEIIYLKKE